MDLGVLADRGVEVGVPKPGVPGRLGGVPSSLGGTPVLAKEGTLCCRTDDPGRTDARRMIATT